MADLQWEIIALLAAAFATARWLYRRHANLPLPPGPKGIPLLGNIFDVPTDCGWETYAKWGQEYKSDLIHLNLAGTHLVVVNTAKAARDLFDQRSSLYSDRPHPIMLLDLTGFDDTVSMMAYGDWWKEQRKLFHKTFNARAVFVFEPELRRARNKFLRHLSDTPKEFFNHIRLSISSVILLVTYGLEVTSFDDPYVTRIERMLQYGAEASVPGAFLVDFLPFLKYVPEFFPGAGFKRKGREWKAHRVETLKAPFQFVKNSMSTKGRDYRTSIISTLLEELDGTEDPSREELIKGFGADIYAAGADTGTSIIKTFFLAMTLYPEAAKKAQEELDRVVGRDRLPDFSDKDSLPYVGALIKEVLRWRPAFPIALPHFLRSDSDDVYNGYRIPTGSMVIGNSWAILHDENIYPDPDSFKPERFLKNGAPDPSVPSPDAAWGFGRRSCAGKEFAVSIIFITIASVLASFDIKTATDDEGREIAPKNVFTGGIIRHALPFECAIKPRSARAAQIIAAANDM